MYQCNEIATKDSIFLEKEQGKTIKRRANDLNGKEWLKYSISIWSDIRKTKEEVNLNHPAIFPVELASRLIKIFTCGENDLIFDPFAGIGSTLVAAKQEGKNSIGFELNPDYVKIANQRLMELTLFEENKSSHIIYNEDSRKILNLMKEETVDLVITSPPYWNVLNEKRTADNKEIRKYSNEDKDLGNIKDYRDFLKELQGIFSNVYKVQKKGSFCCVIVMDIRKKDKFYPFHIDIVSFMQEIGYLFEDIIIWDRKQEYNNFRPLGYPFVFRVNKVHEYILIFKKE
ncbi:MAG: DNA methyltransferase [Brevinematia bacterium]